MIRLDHLERHFRLAEGVVKAVDDVSLEITAGEFVAIMGPSGSGKSTLLYVLGAMDQPTGGWISLADRRIDRMNDGERSRFRNETLGFVFQSFHLLTRLSLLRNVELPMIYSGKAPGERHRRAAGLLAAVGLADKVDRLPTELSGGQCQRAAIARSLANRPRLVLADEPTGNLDSKTGLDVMAIFQALHQQGVTVVMVTHDDNMARHASRILRMKDGRVVDDTVVADRLRAPLPKDLDLNSLGGAA